MFKVYRKLERDEFMVCAVDTSAGGLDYTVAQYLSKTKVDVPIVYRSKSTTSDFIKPLSDSLEAIYDQTGIKPVVALERQNGGSFLMDSLAVHNRLNKYELFRMPTVGVSIPKETIKYGWDTNTATRPKMLQELKEAIDSEVLRVYDQDTVGEMFSFIVAQTSSSWKAQAESGAHDDCITSLAIAWQLYQICKPPVNSMSAGQVISQLPQEPWKKRAWY